MKVRHLYTLPVLVGSLVLGACAEEEEPIADAGVAEEVAVAPAVGTEATGVGFEEWDVDRNAQLAANEFGGWIDRAGIYDRWDADTEAGLNREEFGTGVFGLWDRDRNNQIAEAEWNEGIGAWAGEGVDAGTFADWDVNDDTFLDAGELGEGFERTGLFGEWDRNRNNLIEDTEFDEGFFNVWDTNDDTFLDANEWGVGYERWGAL